jgi:subtilisin family serine protease
MFEAVNMSLGGGARIWGCNGKVDNAHPTHTRVDEVRPRVVTGGTLPQLLLDNDDARHEAVCKVVAAGVPVVVSAGNEAVDASRLVPAGYPEVITVSALADLDGRPGGLAKPQQSCAFNFGDHLPAPDAVPQTGLESVPEHDDTPADFTNYGKAIDVMAPGVCDVSTSPGGLYAVGDGTSFAAPMVAGAAALYRTRHPSATPAQIAAVLKATGTRDYDNRDDPDHIQEPLLNLAALV